MLTVTIKRQTMHSAVQSERAKKLCREVSVIRQWKKPNVPSALPLLAWKIMMCHVCAIITQNQKSAKLQQIPELLFNTSFTS